MTAAKLVKVAAHQGIAGGTEQIEVGLLYKLKSLDPQRENIGRNLRFLVETFVSRRNRFQAFAFKCNLYRYIEALQQQVQEMHTVGAVQVECS